jgi:hypothetical protein
MIDEGMSQLRVPCCRHENRQKIYHPLSEGREKLNCAVYKSNDLRFVVACVADACQFFPLDVTLSEASNEASLCSSAAATICQEKADAAGDEC